MYLDDLHTLIETTTLNKDQLEKTNAKPTKVALWIWKGNLSVCAIYWKGEKGGTWDDENAVSMTNIILDLEPYYRDEKIINILNGE